VNNKLNIFDVVQYDLCTKLWRSFGQVQRTECAVTCHLSTTAEDTFSSDHYFNFVNIKFKVSLTFASFKYYKIEIMSSKIR